MRIWSTLQQLLPLLRYGQLPQHGQNPQDEVILSSERVSLSRTWQVLGPWSIGTREAPWGADPLEFYGGFRNLTYDPDAQYPGSLGTGGEIAWSVFNAKEYSACGQSSAVTLEVSFGEIDWSSHQQVYGWAGLQWQAWTRGFIDVVNEFKESVVLFTDNVLEFYLDGELYFGGDFYAFRRAPLTLFLKPGRHQLDVRLIRDVRAMGATGLPKLEVKLEVVRNLELLNLGVDGFLVPDIFEGKLASRYGSLTLRNNADVAIRLSSIQSVTGDFLISRYGMDEVILAPGQTKPVAFQAEMLNPNARRMELRIDYRLMEDESFVISTNVSHKLKHPQAHEPHRITFLHPSGTVSYAMLRTPPANSTCHSSTTKAPVLLALHGAGVEASDPMTTHSLDAVADLCAWILFPTGTTRWSGDDWHTWGLADVEAAVEHISTWIEHHSWDTVRVDKDQWLVAGHSNGGQGAWFLLTHRPDRVFAAAIVSAYSSIQNYVPYTMWSFADPYQTAVIQASLNDFRHELLAANARGVPILQQHGSADENVPVHHARLMHERLRQAEVEVEYSEILDAGHWFDGVMTTHALQTFYYTQINRSTGSDHVWRFSLVVATPANTGSKQGVHIVSTLDPSQYGKVDFALEADSSTCQFSTENIYSFALAPLYDSCHRVVVDGEVFAPGASLFEWHDAWWGYQRREAKPSNLCYTCRRQRQLGGVDAVLRTTGPLEILYDESTTYRIALQISRNFLQYFGADSVIVDSRSLQTTGDGTGNIVSLLIGRKSHGTKYPLRWNDQGELEIRRVGGAWYVYKDAVAAIFVQPLSDERTEVIVWGSDVDAVGAAARLVPTLTGVGQPDFVILSDACRWKGVGGALAMGFFDREWNVTRSSWFS